MSYKDVAGADPRLVSAAARHFGSVKVAVEAAGRAFVRHPRAGGGRGIGHWSEERVLQALRDLHREGGDLRHRTMKERSQPLFWAARHFFGSYVNAVRVAGIDYWTMSQSHLARQRAGGPGTAE